MLCLWFISQKVSGVSVKTGLLDIELLQLCSFLLVLMGINWVLEAERWRLALVEEELTLSAALHAILCGLALNWVVPFTLGDAGARLANIQFYKKAISALVLNRVILLSITLSFGGISVLYYFNELNDWWFWLLSTGGVALPFVFHMFHPTLNQNRLIRICMISVLRYAVFTLQFYLLLEFFLPSLSPQILLLGIGWIFLFRSFIPSLFGKFGVREASAIVFFQPYVMDTDMVVIPCLLIWAINTLIPSALGAICIFTLKVKIAQ